MNDDMNVLLYDVKEKLQEVLPKDIHYEIILDEFLALVHDYYTIPAITEVLIEQGMSYTEANDKANACIEEDIYFRDSIDDFLEKLLLK